MVQNKFKVSEDQAIDFEKKYSKPATADAVPDGFTAFYLQRRDATTADDGFTYVSSSIWTDRKKYEAWKQTTSGPQSQSCPSCPSTFPVAPSMVSYFEGKLTIYGPL